MVELYKRYNFKTQVLAASIRHPRHVVMAAKAGADVATIPYQVLTHMASHPLTEKGLSQFLADWQSKTKPIM
jgi:transaldolase